MTKPLRTETATERADMPHAFEGDEVICDLCTAGVKDARHVSWEQWETASLARSSEVQREFGS